MPQLAERLTEITDEMDLDVSDVARTVGASPRTVARWLHEESEPRPSARERLLEVLTVLERLTRVVQPDAARDWLFTPVPELDFEKPADLLRTGQYRRVLGAVDALADGVFL